MSQVKYWTNQTVQMQSALGAAQTITGINKASPGVVTTSGTLPSNGAYVLLEVAGMRQLNNRVFKVAGASGSDFNIGVDTTLFDTFASGTFRVITFGLAFDSIRDLASSGGDPVFEDATSIHDAEDLQDIVSSSPQTFSGTHNWDPTSEVLIAMNQAFIVRQPRAFRFADPDGSEYLFYATVVAPLQPTVSGKKKVTPLSWSLKATGTSY